MKNGDFVNAQRPATKRMKMPSETVPQAVETQTSIGATFA